MPRANTKSNFYSRFDEREPSACWEWKGKRNSGGYGAFSLRQRLRGAHVYAWEFHNGQEVPAGMVVMHSCDNPACVNPSHLSVGTMLDNQRDMARKGRSCAGDRNGSRILRDRIRRGDQHHNAKLNTVLVADIKAALLVESNQRAVARRFGIDFRSVWKIAHGLAWSHVRAS